MELKFFLVTLLDVQAIGYLSRCSTRWFLVCQKSAIWRNLCLESFDSQSLPVRGGADGEPLWKKVFEQLSTPIEKAPQFHDGFRAISLQHAEILLAHPGIKRGSMIFRSSSTYPNTIAITYVSNTNTIQHRRLYRLDDGNYSFHHPSSSRQPDVFKYYTQLVQRLSKFTGMPMVALSTIAYFNIDTSKYEPSIYILPSLDERVQLIAEKKRRSPAYSLPPSERILHDIFNLSLIRNLIQIDSRTVHYDI